ncbi:solute carrier organic anion transporter family member 4A1-like [Amphiura filiformis]|uniref:solute carrier organic anion transporter family member 4A1-like n=1 Tax=Amphiura filiformis TaxID=82378 RepID=UPI003B221B7C
MASSDSESEVSTAYAKEGYSEKGEMQDNDAPAEPKSTSKYQTDDAADDEVLDEEELKLYGYGSCRPKHMQLFHNSKGFLFAISLYCFTHGMAIGLFYIMISTIEQRFNLTSRQGASISRSYDLFGMLFVMFVSYFGEHGHKPRLIGISAIIFSLGSLTFTFPHYLAGPYNPEEGPIFDTCDVNRTVTDQCVGDDDNLQKYYAVFIVAQMLHALGASTIFNLGLTHIDENVTRGTAAVYTGIFWSVAVLGPSVGLVAGGVYLDTFVDVFADNIPITPESPFWVGCWWLGFVGTSFFAAYNAFPLLGYNRRLPGYTKAQKKRRNETRLGCQFQSQSKISQFPKAVLALLKNPTYVLITVGVIAEAFIIAFVSVFGPKILESLFNLKTINAALLAGLSITPAGIIGPLLGGYLLKRYKMTVSQTLKFCAYSEDQFNLTASCNSLCKCEDEYDPVCGSDGIMYYSACHAGCTVEKNETKGAKEYSECACIPPVDGSLEDYGTAKANRCGTDCAYLIPFLVVAFFSFLFTYLVPVPYITATMRCVDYSQRNFALGVQTFFNKGLGVVPGPIAFGALLNRACLLWEYECDGSQNCWLYDNSQMTIYLVLMISACRLVSILAFTGAALTYKPPKDGAYQEDGNKALYDVEMTGLS